MSIYPSNIRRCLLVLAFFSVVSSTLAQTCQEALEQAQTQYEQGQVNEALKLLEACDGSSDINQLWKNYRLKAMCHLANNDEAEARKAAVKMLEINPKYKGQEYSDPSDLIDLINSITVIPKFSLGMALSAGSNSSFPRIIDVYSLGDFSKQYKGRSRFQFGFSTNYQLNKSFGLQSGLFISPKSYQIDYKVNNWQFMANETLTYVQIPFSLKYYPRTAMRLRPYAQLGAYASYMLKADHNLRGDNTITEEHIELLHTSSLDRRTRGDGGLILGLGANYRLGEGHLSIHANYHYSSININNDENRYDNNDVLYTFYYLEDDLSLSYFNLGIGYSLYINYKVLNQ